MFSTLILSVEFRMLLLPRKVPLTVTCPQVQSLKLPQVYNALYAAATFRWPSFHISAQVSVLCISAYLFPSASSAAFFIGRKYKS